MATVKLFGNLREYTAANVIEDMQGETIRRVLTALCADNTPLQDAILDGDGLQPFVRIMVNGHDCELAQGLETPVTTTDQIAIFPPIAGG